jgi:hypothetical protein
VEWGSLKYTESYWSLVRFLVLTNIIKFCHLLCHNSNLHHTIPYLHKLHKLFSVIFPHNFYSTIISTVEWPTLFYLFHILKFQVESFKFLSLYNWSWQHVMEVVNKVKCKFIQILAKRKLEVVQVCASLFGLPLFTCKCTYKLTKSQMVHIYSHIVACQPTYLTYNFGFWE